VRFGQDSATRQALIVNNRKLYRGLGIHSGCHCTGLSSFLEAEEEEIVIALAMGWIETIDDDRITIL
jgi:hypothetical protein